MTSYYNQVNGLGPKVWFKFDETTGTPSNSGSLSCTLIANNYKSDGFGGELPANPPTINQNTDIDGRSVYFNGDAGYGISALPAMSVFDDKSFSYETWFKPATNNTAADGFLFKAGSFQIRFPGTLHPTTSQRNKILVDYPISTGVGNYTTTNTYNDNKWHHLVVTYNTTSLKVYIDGGIVVNNTISTPATLNIDSVTFPVENDGTVTNISIGSRLFYGENNTSRIKAAYGFGFVGWLDEFALYDYELTAVQVNANYVAGTAVYVDWSASTASALIVEPTWTNSTNPYADPMTASAEFAEAQQADIDLPILLNTYMQSLSDSGYLEQWYKFDKYKVITNYGTSGQTGFGFFGNVDSRNQSGLQGSGCLKFTGSLQDGFISSSATAVAAFVPEVTDNNWVMGFWLKVPTGYPTNGSVFNLSDNTGKYIGFNQNQNYLNVNIRTSSGDHSVGSSINTADDQWHFIVGKLSSGVLELFVDNVSQGTITVNGSLMTTITAATFSANNIPPIAGTPYINMSHFFGGSTTNITNTVLTNIYNAGSASVQAAAELPMAAFKNDNAFNTYALGLDPYFYYKLDEATGIPQSVGQANAILNQEGTNLVQNVSTKNNKGIQFNNRDTAFGGSWTAPAGTFSASQKQTLAIYARATTNNNANHIGGTAGFGNNPNASALGVGMGMLFSGNNFICRIFNAAGQFDTITETTNYLDGQYHLFVGIKDGNTLSLYVDGKHKQTITSNYNITDNGLLAIGGAAGVGPVVLGRDLTVDEFIVFADALTPTEIFELYRSLSETMDTTATTEMIMPVISGGTGLTATVDPMTASAEKIYPTHWAPPMSAFADFMMPNYYAEVIIDDQYFASPMECSALFHDPQYQIGEFNSADHMNASAEMVHPTSISGGTISVSPCVSLPAILVMPGIVTVKGKRIFAEPMRSNAILPLPPAYITLNDDQWYVRLLQGHADNKTEAIQAFVGNLPNQTTNDVITGGFLSFFEEVDLDITPSTNINSISSEIPAYYFDPPGSIQYDENGVLIPLDTTKNVSRASATRAATNPTPMLSAGYFDDYERKAVRVENIEFVFPGTSIYHSERPYNIEFSFKSTKSDQVIAYGQWNSFYYTGRKIGVIGLSDGKIYLAEDQYKVWSPTGTPGLGDYRRNVSATAPHPKNLVNRAQYLLGKTNIADGQWHHIIIQQGWVDGRTQIWVDGKLDRQIGARSDAGSFASNTPGLDGTNNIRPYILGFNSRDSLLYSDFQTSAWNFYPGRFLDSQEIGLNNLAYTKSDPIPAEPMIATFTIGQQTTGSGNRGRLLLLHWWKNPVGYNQNVVTTSNPLTTGYSSNNSPFGPADLIDDPKRGPLYWEGWDVFPVGIISPSPSDITKKENQGAQGGYLDIENGRLRMLDLQKDLDLSNFDTIMFANYPTTSAQLDEYIRKELVDDYFGVTEQDIYQDFLKSLRAAVDSGMSLLVQFDQLARDLKIYDRVEVIPIFNEGVSDERAFWHTNNVNWDLANNRPDAYVSSNPSNPEFNILDEEKSIRDIDLANGAYFEDRYNNMRHRVVNTIELLTDDPTYIQTDRARYQHSDILDFGSPDRIYERFEYRTQGLQPGDEFVFGNPSNVTQFGNSRARQTSILAVPFENIKAGRVITAQPEKYYKGNEYVDNPYKNYAHSIALLPGDVLDGKGVGGKIFVSISEVFWDKSEEYKIVDLYTDYWIDISYDLGFFGPVGSQQAITKRDEIKSSSPYFSPIGKTTEHYNWATYWSRNDNFAFTQVDRQQDFSGVLGLLFESSIELDKVPTSRKALASFSRRRDQLGRFASGTGGSGALFFQMKTGRITQIMNVFVPNLFTRAFWWLSERERPTGLVQRPEKATATVTMPNALAIVDKQININAPVMLANASAPGNVTGTITIISSSISITTLPLTATATIVELGKRIFASPMTVTALAVQPGIFTYSLEEIILTIADTEAIVYIRGDKVT